MTDDNMGSLEEEEDRTVPMEPGLREAFTVLSRKLVELHILWQQYRQLFADDPEAIPLLNKTAGLFFRVVQDQLWDSVLLGVCRMTDRSEHPKWKEKNLTILSLPPLIQDEKLKDEVADLCNKAVNAAKYAREHRHKRIAHQDHAYTANPSAHPLSGVSRELVETMLKAFRDVMQRVHGHYDGVDMRYEVFIDNSGARALLSKLKNSERLAKP